MDTWVSDKGYALSSALTSYAPKDTPTFTGTVTLPASQNVYISTLTLDSWVSNKGYALSSALTTYALKESPTLNNVTLNGNITLSNTSVPGINQLGYIEYIVNDTIDLFAIATAWTPLLQLKVSYTGYYLVFFSFAFGYSNGPFLQYSISTLIDGPDDIKDYHTFGVLGNGYDYKCMNRVLYLYANNYIYALARCTSGNANISYKGTLTTNVGGSAFYAIRIG